MGFRWLFSVQGACVLAVWTGRAGTGCAFRAASQTGAYFTMTRMGEMRRTKGRVRGSNSALTQRRTAEPGARTGLGGGLGAMWHKAKLGEGSVFATVVRCAHRPARYHIGL
ncbi:hypothetical protein BS50DRAFT_177577 [Corynespora cassiicola Philippines]|uniref:Secreted protein n=1 Tax=Corynespora cassiicola Philippines TaxID=1448308 RepID=A0A2T2P5V1_CORCC|nr:hypothetical protein BS50DRAFT_177577 [Corynespora cassiicola Philippines]